MFWNPCKRTSIVIQQIKPLLGMFPLYIDQGILTMVSSLTFAFVPTSCECLTWVTANNGLSTWIPATWLLGSASSGLCYHRHLKNLPANGRPISAFQISFKKFMERLTVWLSLGLRWEHPILECWRKNRLLCVWLNFLLICLLFVAIWGVVQDRISFFLPLSCSFSVILSFE